MGMDRITVQNLKIVARREDGILLISGSVPGANGGLVIIRPAKKKGTHAEELVKAETRKKALEKSTSKTKK